MNQRQTLARSVAVTCALLWAIGGGAACGGTIRHDRADSLHTTLAADPRFAAVGKITGSEPDGGFLASGTLIRDQWVLTAAHVINGTDGHGAGVSNLRFQVGGAVLTAAEWFVHPNWATSGGENNLFAGWDLGLVRLDQPVSNVAPASLFAGSNEVGQVATIVGFGATGTGLTGSQPNTAGTKRAGNNIVDVAGVQTTPGSTVSIGHERMLAIDFDQPSNPSASTLGGTTPINLEYLAAPGDSGGGLFLEVGGQMLLAGVTSPTSTLDGSVNSDYGDRAAFTRVSQFLSWVDATIAANSPLTSPILPGDYNRNGVVDAADYTVWRDSLGQSGADLVADGNGDGVINSDDYDVWKSNFSTVAGTGGGLAESFSAGQSIPEPAAIILIFLGVPGAFVIPLRAWSRRRRSKRSDARDEDIQVLSDAEFYLLLGKRSRWGLSHPGCPELIRPAVQLAAADIVAARRFAESPSSFVLRALIEEWSWQRIKSELDELDTASASERFGSRYTR